MVKDKHQKVLILLAIGLLLLAGGLMAAPDEPLNGFAIPWWTADGGGGESSGGSYTLQGTAGQPDAGGASGGDFALKGGFWAVIPIDSAPGATDIYLPSVIR